MTGNLGLELSGGIGGRRGGRGITGILGLELSGIGGTREGRDHSHLGS
jgi:hypothetical protein